MFAMASPSLRLVPNRPEPQSRLVRAPRQPLGRCLVEQGVITPDQLVKALHLQLSLSAPLGQILISEGWASEEEIQTALAGQFGLDRIDISGPLPDPRICAMKPATFWLRHRILPWRRAGDVVLIATNRPDRFEALRGELEAALGPVAPVLASGADIAAATAKRFRPILAQAADRRVPGRYSFRSRGLGMTAIAPLLLCALAGGLALAPSTGFAVLSLIAFATFILFLLLRITALVSYLRANDPFAPAGNAPAPQTGAPRNPNPKVSVLVPLYQEREIVGALIPRLTRLTYPKALLDVVLVLEEKDEVTRQTLAEAKLPPWMRIIEVPAFGGLTTKPRAMNYALDFCEGEIVGIWDAEDAPACDQIERIVDRFAQAPEDVACLQGILDFYNPRTNWLSRCFCIEYSAWFRVMLPGIARHCPAGPSCPAWGNNAFHAPQGVGTTGRVGRA